MTVPVPGELWYYFDFASEDEAIYDPVVGPIIATPGATTIFPLWVYDLRLGGAENVPGWWLVIGQDASQWLVGGGDFNDDFSNDFSIQVSLASHPRLAFVLEWNLPGSPILLNNIDPALLANLQVSSVASALIRAGVT